MNIWFEEMKLGVDGGSISSHRLMPPDVDEEVKVVAKRETRFGVIRKDTVLITE